jgi:hypothetical protein
MIPSRFGIRLDISFRRKSFSLEVMPEGDSSGWYSREVMMLPRGRLELELALEAEPEPAGKPLEALAYVRGVTGSARRDSEASKRDACRRMAFCWHCVSFAAIFPSESRNVEAPFLLREFRHSLSSSTAS